MQPGSVPLWVNLLSVAVAFVLIYWMAVHNRQK